MRTGTLSTRPVRALTDTDNFAGSYPDNFGEGRDIPGTFLHRSKVSTNAQLAGMVMRKVVFRGNRIFSMKPIVISGAILPLFFHNIYIVSFGSDAEGCTFQESDDVSVVNGPLKSGILSDTMSPVANSIALLSFVLCISQYHVETKIPGCKQRKCTRSREKGDQIKETSVR